MEMGRINTIDEQQHSHELSQDQQEFIEIEEKILSEEEDNERPTEELNFENTTSTKLLPIDDLLSDKIQ